MINITIYDDGFKIEGHAGYAEKGKDIICAGVSALSQTCMQSIIELTQDEPIYFETDGYMDMRCENPSAETKILLKSFRIGIEAIGESYPEFIKVVRIVR